jgi:hypothetical protein
MDSAVPYASERVRRIFGENNVMAMTLPAHPANLCQRLDLVFVGVLEKLKAPANGDSPTAPIYFS